MLMKNTKSKPIRVKAAVLAQPPKDAKGRPEKYAVIEAGAEVECRDGYCHPMVAANGSRAPSIIEKVAPGLKPAKEDELKKWLEVPESDYVAPKRELSADQLRAMGVAPKVAKLKEAKAKAEAMAKAATPRPAESETKEEPSEEASAAPAEPASKEDTKPDTPSAKKDKKSGKK